MGSYVSNGTATTSTVGRGFLPPLGVLEIFCPRQAVLPLLEHLILLMTGPYLMLQTAKAAQVIMVGT